MRGHRGYVLGTAFLALAAAGLAPVASAQTLKPFKYGISTAVVNVFPAFMADAYKIFEKHGLKTDIVSMEGGSRGIQVLLSGEIQAMSVGIAPVIQANIEGADVRSIASTANKIPITFFAQSKIKGPQDIKGANIGISVFGSETDFSVSLALKKWGLTRNDVQISQVGGTTQRYAALVAGRIDVAPLIEPAITLAKQKGGFNVVLDLVAEQVPWIFDSVVVNKQSITANADGLQRFLKAYSEGAYMARAEPDKAKAVIAARWKTQDQAVIEATYKDFLQLVPPDVRPSLDGARNVLSELKGFGIKVKSDNLDDYLDTTLLTQLDKAGFFDEMRKQYGQK